ncbi:hypothetical protein EVAR_89869_1 [Eumeta japonica]|uniref:Uncharacterized protein n=1 Tax=Eumeta variegata TaxID=151549 RepID=A0A4C1ZMA5_EUMVA|nr:hypothetical protein EVAR_89869_1 [Eumeta japonica]
MASERFGRCRPMWIQTPGAICVTSTSSVSGYKAGAPPPAHRRPPPARTPPPAPPAHRRPPAAEGFASSPRRWYRPRITRRHIRHVTVSLHNYAVTTATAASISGPEDPLRRTAADV